MKPWCSFIVVSLFERDPVGSWGNNGLRHVFTPPSRAPILEWYVARFVGLDLCGAHVNSSIKEYTRTTSIHKSQLRHFNWTRWSNSGSNLMKI
jgi:hypothetical protein